MRTKMPAPIMAPTPTSVASIKVISRLSRTSVSNFFMGGAHDVQSQESPYVFAILSIESENHNSPIRLPIPPSSGRNSIGAGPQSGEEIPGIDAHDPAVVSAFLNNKGWQLQGTYQAAIPLEVPGMEDR